jgi:ADP-heptose:LPS heptosyltransferase
MALESPVRRVLIYRLGSLGDTVAALPCFHLVERLFPQADRRLLTNFPVHAKAPAAAAVLGESGLVHGYIPYTAGTRRPHELLRLAWKIRRFSPDLLVYLMPIRPTKSVQRDAAFFRMAGARRIVGLPSEADNRRRVDAATGLYEAEAVRLARGIAELGDARPDDLASWDLRLTSAEKATARRELELVMGRPVIVCAPGCKMQANDWEGENWRALLGRLYRRYPEYALAMAGAKEDAAVCEFAASQWGGAKVMLAGRLTPRESAAAFEHGAVFVGPDSGPKHLAASVGLRCVCVFGARDLPGVWFPPGGWFAPGEGHQVIYHQPECFGCGLETCIENQKKCIRSVTVDEAERAVVRVLG